MKELIARLVTEFIQPLLREHRFKKRRVLWNRTRGFFVDVIRVQEATYSTEQSQVFTVNIGVCMPSLNDLIWDGPLKGFASEADCVIRHRLGDVMQGKLYGDSLDTWWTLSAPGELEVAGEEIREALEIKALPFLESFDSIESIVNHLDRMSGWQSAYPLMIIYRALAEWKSGSPSTALKTLEPLRKQGGAWASKAISIEAAIKSAK